MEKTDRSRIEENSEAFVELVFGFRNKSGVIESLEQVRIKLTGSGNLCEINSC